MANPLSPAIDAVSDSSGPSETAESPNKPASMPERRLDPSSSLFLLFRRQPRLCTSPNQAEEPCSREKSPSAPHPKVIYDEREPTSEERETLRHVPEKVPLSAGIVAIVELCERFSFYGCQGLFQNYIQRPYKGTQGPGALGLGQRGATALGMFFQFWCYVTPLAGAVAADQYLGKYWTIVGCSIIYLIGLIILTVTSFGFSLQGGGGLGGFITAIILMGIGAGGIKVNVGPLIADQYTRKKMAVKRLRSGETVILSPALTIQRIYMMYYLTVHIGSLAVLGTSYMEKKLPLEFTSAYILCLSVFLAGLLCLVWGRKQYATRPTKSRVFTNLFRVIWIMIKNGHMDAPKPSWRRERAGGNDPLDYPWDDAFIEEVTRALVACKVLSFLPIFWTAYSQVSTNLVSQAGQMDSHGLPNDLMQVFDALTLMIFGLALQQIIYPCLQKMRIRLPAIARITLGFLSVSLAMGYAAIVQSRIYMSPPCYETPRCPASIVNGTAQGNKIHIALQAPTYFLTGISELLTSVTCAEYAYRVAPPSMRSFVQAVFLLTSAFGAAIVAALSRVTRDPQITWMYTGVGCATFITMFIFWACFRGLDEPEEASEVETPHDEDQSLSGESVGENPVARLV
ncbi:hypothetical protein Dda_5668 [Drechslerella dactyloides]|uniref:Uncharacterized protein n=1 Tax=Drechslerella dactyloides TaxID=74499 RepID=A0AAD6IWM8_DREDA|nr:hypothetical protein Dda_5668 [Drechslerella dactyloides]